MKLALYRVGDTDVTAVAGWRHCRRCRYELWWSRARRRRLLALALAMLFPMTVELSYWRTRGWRGR